jgi:hypothetical protein
MSDHEISKLCEEKFRHLDEHIKEAPAFRDAVTKHQGQILTLEKAHEATMADIREIKADVSTIKADMKDLMASVKIWVLSGIVATVMAFAVPTMMLFYNAGRMQQQLDTNTERWNKVISMSSKDIK